MCHQVLFWGVRDFRRIQLLSVDRPRVDVECAGKILQSKRIDNIDKNSNFDEPLQYFDLVQTITSSIPACSTCIKVKVSLRTSNFFFHIIWSHNGRKPMMSLITFFLGSLHCF